MKIANRELSTRYLLSVCPSDRKERYSVKVVLRKGATTNAKRLNQDYYKKGLFALKSHD